VTYLAEVDILSGYSDNTFRPDQEITRAELATVLVRSEEGKQLAKATEQTFTDVPTSLWASGYIEEAHDLGYVNGYGNGQFKPNDPVTCEEAVTMIVRMCGKNQDAIAQGGYPDGYWSVAEDLSLLDNVTISADDNTKRHVVAQLIYNTLGV